MTYWRVILWVLSATSVSGFLPASSFRACSVAEARRLSNIYADSSAGIKTYADYRVYKDQSCLSLKVIPPTFEEKGRSRNVKKAGTILIEIVPKLKSAKHLDWPRKHSFALTAGECAKIILDDDVEIARAVVKQGPNQGNPSKVLRIISENDNKDVTIAASTVGLSPCSITIPTSELEVIRSIMSYCIPKLLGFDVVWDIDKQSASGAFSGYDSGSGSGLAAVSDSSDESLVDIDGVLVKPFVPMEQYKPKKVARCRRGKR